ncbi:hypothetical protein [Streptomyces bikiniensis]|uniref:Uncharacterized protein n=1 Tax=Streptomyces bikiniensis TaxID=1896 RepID=A0ABW8CPZ9_STRBI|nr:hypothetical protein [Streptomyces bikiniensis]
MGKKQTRVNKGARTGGHEHRTDAAAKEKSSRSTAREAPIPAVEHAHRRERRFGHN